MIAIKKIAVRVLLAGASGLFALHSQAALPIQHWQLDSGAQVYLVATDALPIVDVEIDFDAGSRRDPAPQAGLAGVTAEMLEKGVRAAQGEPALDQNALGEAWADLGASFDAGASADRMSFTLRSLADPALLGRAVALAARQIGEPAFPEAVWERERNASPRRSAKPTASPPPSLHAPFPRRCTATIPTATTPPSQPWRASTPRPCGSSMPG